MRIFTTGHSTHSLEAFVALLGRHGVEALADVRTVPRSRRVPHAAGEALARSLPEHGVAYEHFPELGGWRRPRPDSPNGGWRIEAFRGYADHMASAEFAAGLERLEQLASRRPTAMMCAEALWWRCHRRLLSDALLARGCDILHLDARGATQPHRLTEFAVVDGERVSYPPAQAALEV